MQGSSDPSGEEFNLSFVEVGLPEDGVWYVLLFDSAENLTLLAEQATFNTTIEFDVPNGTYFYEVASEGYTPSPEVGNVTVDGTVVAVGIVFADEASDSFVVNANVTFGSTTTVTFYPEGGTAPYSLSGFVDVLSYEDGNFTYACGSGNITGAAYAFSCPDVLAVSWLVVGVTCVYGQSDCSLYDGTALLAYNLGAYANPEYYVGLGYWSTATTWITVNQSDEQPDVTIDANVSILEGPNSTGSPCPCSLRVFGVDLENFSSVNLTFLDATTVSLSLDPGIYFYEFSATNGNPFLIPLASSIGEFIVSPSVEPTYNVTLAETGLPPGTDWSIDFNGDTQDTTSSSMDFEEANGTYRVSVGPVPGFATPVSSGWVRVAGGNLTLTVPFARTYNVTFAPGSGSALPANKTWSVTFGGSRQSAAGNQPIVFTVLNGTYAFTVGALSGYSASPSSGTEHVAGANLTVNVTFATAPKLTATPSSGAAGTSVTFSGGGFGANGAVSVTWSAGTACSGTANASGNFSCIYTIPSSTAGGVHTFTASDTNSHSAAANFTVAFLNLSSESGPVGTALTLTTGGFAASTEIVVSDSAGTVCDGVTGSAGAYDCSAAVPVLPAGTLTLTAKDARGTSATASFSITPQLSLDVSSGPTATDLTFSGTGFGASIPVLVRYTAGAVGNACNSTTAANGSFSCSYVVPSTAAPGSYTFGAIDTASHSASVEFTVTSSLTASPSAPAVGATVTFSGSGFAPSTRATVGWSRGTACTATVAAEGTFQCTFVVPQIPYGTYVFSATDTSAHSAATELDVVPSLAVTPAAVRPGAGVLVTGAGYTAGSAISVSWPHGTVCATTAGANGSFSCRFAVPSDLSTGIYPFRAVDALTHTASASLAVSNATLEVAPGQATVGTTVTFTGTGFAAGESATVSWTRGEACSASVNSSGGFSCGYAIPSGTPAGNYTFTARDADSNVGVVNVSVVALPTYTVTFTESGLPASSNWSVTLNGTTVSSTTSTITFDLTNATYRYTAASVPGTPASRGHRATPGYAPSPVEGNVTVSGGGSVAVTYTLADSVTFKEVGLLSLETWTVSTPAARASATTPLRGSSSIVLAEPSGSLTFTVSPPSGYGVAEVTGTSSPSWDTATISGPTTLVVHFGPLENLYFETTGLPSGTSWSVTISSGYSHGGVPGSQSKSSMGSSIEFMNVVKGPWKFTVTVGSPYAAHPPSGSVAVAAHATTKEIRFSEPRA